MLGSLIGLTLSFLNPTLYVSSTVLAPALSLNASRSTTGGLAALANITGLQGSQNQDVDLALEYLRSYKFSEHLYPLLRKDIPKSFDHENKSISGWNKWLNKRLGVTRKKNGFLLVALSWDSPAAAHNVLNIILKNLNENLKSDQLKRIEARIKYIEQEILDIQTAEVKSSLYKLLVAELEQKALVNSRELYAFTSIDPPIIPSNRKSFAKAFTLAGFVIGLVIAGVCIAIKHESEFRLPLLRRK